MADTRLQLIEAQEHVAECQQRVLDQENLVKALIQAEAPRSDAVTLLRLLHDALQLAEINCDIQEIIELSIRDQDADA